MKRVCLYGIIGGAVLYVFQFLFSELVHIDLPHTWFAVCLALIALLGFATVIFTLMHRCPSVTQSLFRFLMLAISFAIFFILNACVGTVSFWHRVFGVVESSAPDDGSGMLTLAFGLVVLGACAVAFIFMAAKAVWTKAKTQKSTTDDSTVTFEDVIPRGIDE